LDCNHKRERKGKKLTRLRGSFPSVQGKQLIRLLLSKRPSFSENLKWHFSGDSDSLYFRGLEKGKRQRESWEGAAVDQAVFAIQLSILNRMSFLAEFSELGSGTFPTRRLAGTMVKPSVFAKLDFIFQLFRLLFPGYDSTRETASFRRTVAVVMKSGPGNTLGPPYRG
jgi:hypothetical protein